MSTAALFRISGKPGEKKPKYLSIIDSVVFYSDRTLKKNLGTSHPEPHAARMTLTNAGEKHVREGPCGA